jgi:hypothetical protein
MKKSELRKLIKETINQFTKNSLPEGKDCKCPGGVGCCYNQNHCNDGEICKSLCCVPEGYRDMEKRSKRIKSEDTERDNTCTNKNFCCKDKYTKQSVKANLQDGVCMCPKGSMQVNCPK